VPNRIALALCLLSLALACATTPRAPVERPTRPSILILLADDLGARDPSVYGSAFYETPNLDRLAEEGMRFTQAYAAGSVCSPTRASIQTGKYPARTGITDFLPGHRPTGTGLEVLEPMSHLDATEVTLADALATGGYQTFYGGKWHLGRAANAPEQHGYETVPRESGSGAERSRAVVAGAVDFLKQRDPSKPFFAFLSLYEPHTPIERYHEHIEHFEEKARTLGASPPPIPERRPDARAAGRSGLRLRVAGLDDQVGLVLDTSMHSTRARHDRGVPLRQRRLRDRRRAGADQQRAAPRRQGLALRGRHPRSALDPRAAARRARLDRERSRDHERSLPDPARARGTSAATRATPGRRESRAAPSRRRGARGPAALLALPALSRLDLAAGSAIGSVTGSWSSSTTADVGSRSRARPGGTDVSRRTRSRRAPRRAGGADPGPARPFQAGSASPRAELTMIGAWIFARPERVVAGISTADGDGAVASPDLAGAWHRPLRGLVRSQGARGCAC
jgi:hypothetical protein